jgi:hypothetical protein
MMAPTGPPRAAPTAAPAACPAISAPLPGLFPSLMRHVTTVSRHYKATAAEILEHPDMEKDGRWKPNAVDTSG